MQRWIAFQVKQIRRQIGRPEPKTTELAQRRKAAMLKRLGLDKKVSESAPWHVEHMKEGDVFEGSFVHPDFNGGNTCDLKLTVGPEEKTVLVMSNKGDVEQDFTLMQDFPIRVGEPKDSDMAEYCMHKFNSQWRTFEDAVPSRDEMKYLGLPGLRIFFELVAQVKEYPEEPEFKEACSEPEKGMTKEEFLTYLHSDDPEYLSKSFVGVYTGRRLNLVADNSPFAFDGDFQRELEGMVFGYVEYNGVKGGTFKLKLQQ